MKKILIADDEPHIRQLLTDFLTSLGYATVEAANGLQAVEKVRTERPDLVLLDVLMPQMNGIEALKRIKRDFPETVVIVLSALQEEATARDAIRGGAYDYLTKPINLNKLQRDFLARVFGE